MSADGNSPGAVPAARIEELASAVIRLSEQVTSQRKQQAERNLETRSRLDRFESDVRVTREVQVNLGADLRIVREQVGTLAGAVEGLRRSVEDLKDYAAGARFLKWAIPVAIAATGVTTGALTFLVTRLSP